VILYILVARDNKKSVINTKQNKKINKKNRRSKNRRTRFHTVKGLLEQL